MINKTTSFICVAMIRLARVHIPSILVFNLLFDSSLDIMSSSPRCPPASGNGEHLVTSRSENLMVDSKKGSNFHYSIGSGSRSLGRRSRDAVRSVKNSIQSRQALNITTNQRSTAPTLHLQAESSPGIAIKHSVKQRWNDSFRGRGSQRSTDSSCSSKESRYLKSLSDKSAGSSSEDYQKFHIALPQLDFPSLQDELQHSQI
jgi:hypothetical protein